MTHHHHPVLAPLGNIGHPQKDAVTLHTFIERYFPCCVGPTPTTNTLGVPAQRMSDYVAS